MDETYYINKCHAGNRIDRKYNQCGYTNVYEVEDKKIELDFQQWPEGDDYQEELTGVKIYAK